MKAEIITIGDELLIGMTEDTNSTWIGAELTSIGIDVFRKTTIHDNRVQILDAVDQAMKAADLVIVTGGLGPTSDDITKPALADYFNTRLVFNKTAFKAVETLLNKRKLPLNENNRRQAELPANCVPLLNEKGTAPGMWFEKNESVLVSLPGVPHEMRHLISEKVIPKVKQRFRLDNIYYRLVMTYGSFEARLAEILEDFENEIPSNISLAYLPTRGIIKLRLTGKGENISSLKEEVDEQVKKLDRLIPQFIYGYDGVLLEETIGKLLKDKGQTIGTAESCTGGTIAEMITSIPGASSWFTGSVVAYDNKVKVSSLGVSEDTLMRKGAVSEEVAVMMAQGIRQQLGCDWGLATTGIAGPDGGTGEKPVGTVWIAVSGPSGVEVRNFTFGNQRDMNIRRSSLAALDMLRRGILKFRD